MRYRTPKTIRKPYIEQLYRWRDWKRSNLIGDDLTLFIGSENFRVRGDQTTHEVMHLNDWYGEPANIRAQQLCGTAHDLYRPMLIVPLEPGQTTHAERAYQQGFFAAMEAAISGASAATDLGYDVIIVVPGPDENAA
ncbi:hypothetical protein SAMN04488058_101277 [Deinococcus reticulitermitis]|uniref:Uncharacterized protein n=1 Tax=Deinococcus reticulitermitis TaxID=856736 RepID=A0A1H6SEB0_9DEIO|nr:hypothetical protein [Deinococcus reticulitermitis]SEI66313.1 hypothetical protein SAMN04488058_101277 [Deinococcus reticulitermitis]